MSPDRTRRQEKVVTAKALLIVRAEVADPADRPHFDRWYNEEHLRDALATFQADRAWRSWSKSAHCQIRSDMGESCDPNPRHRRSRSATTQFELRHD